MAQIDKIFCNKNKIGAKKREMRNLLFLIIFSVIALGAAISFTQGEQAQVGNSARAEDKSAFGGRCASIQERIQFRTTQYDNNKDRHLKSYNNLKDRISKFVERLTASGYDTTKLKTDLQQLDEKIKQFAQDYTAFINKLKETKDLACGHSEDEFRTKLLEARDLLGLAHQDAAEVRNFYQTVIRPDILVLKDQKPSATATATTVSNQK